MCVASTSPYRNLCRPAQDLFGEPGAVQPHFGTAAARDLAAQVQSWAALQAGTLSGSEQLAGLTALQTAAADLVRRMQVTMGSSLVSIPSGSGLHASNCSPQRRCSQRMLRSTPGKQAFAVMRILSRVTRLTQLLSPYMTRACTAQSQSISVTPTCMCTLAQIAVTLATRLKLDSLLTPDRKLRPWQELQASLAADTAGARSSELGAELMSADALQRLGVGTLPAMTDRGALDDAMLAAARAYTSFSAAGMNSMHSARSARVCFCELFRCRPAARCVQSAAVPC